MRDREHFTGNSGDGKAYSDRYPPPSSFLNMKIIANNNNGCYRVLTVGYQLSSARGMGPFT